MKWIWYSVLGVLTILFLILAIFIFMMGKPVIDYCNRAGPTWVRPYCVYIDEKYADNSIPNPQQQLYLGNFTYDPNLPGGPLCDPMYYAFRYVRISDGGYSKLSPWTTTPIYSGAKTLPCYPSGKSTDNCAHDNIPTGSSTCKNNRPVIVTVDPLDLAIIDGYVLNLHRQVGTFDPNSEGQMIGFLMAGERNNPDGNGWTSNWVDVLFNPNPNGNRCKGC